MDQDIIDNWRDMRKHSQHKRKLNREKSTSILDAIGIPYASKNNGVHLILKHSKHGFVDYWPGTGKWFVRSSNEYRRGIRNLVNLFRDEIK